MSWLIRLLTLYLPIAPHRLVYMLQLVDYDWRAFIKWCLQIPNIRHSMRRGSLVYTKKAKALLLAAYTLYVLGITLSLLLASKWLVALGLLIIVPDVVIGGLMLVVVLGNAVLRVARRGVMDQARQQLAASKGIKIAVLGSYGKTTMKELLLAVLGSARNVKATPGNMNVPISHARWITTTLYGNEDVIILEYGEGKPGDIAVFVGLSQPEYAVLTGVAPNHLDQYPNYQALKTDLSAIADGVQASKLLVHAQAQQELNLDNIVAYDEHMVGDWRISHVAVGYDGTSFTMSRKGRKLRLHSPLLGRHQVGPLAAVAYLALELGLSTKQVTDGIAHSHIFAHRMQPRYMHGAWIIDDTYNGNLEGIRAGLALLSELPAKRKIYVTPGLVDQGSETERVHREIGTLIAAANPDKVVLMQNSVTGYMQAGMEAAGYNGAVELCSDPKDFYTNLEHVIAGGDLYMLQNDWPDQYA